MSILGLVARTRPADRASLRSWLAGFAGIEVALDPGDGRLILVIEDTDRCPAAAAMAEVALHPLVVDLSLVYEYSGSDSPSATRASQGFSAWRASLADLLVPAADLPPWQVPALPS